VVVSPLSPPVTTPTLSNQFQGVATYPPLHPIEKQERNPQHPVVSATDNKVVSPVLIQTRSFNASVVPWAQHDPQFD